MWIGTIRLQVRTKDAPHAGTDDDVVVTIVRDGADVATVNLNKPNQNDLEQRDFRDYDYTQFPRSTDQTVVPDPEFAAIPTPYPPHGIEFSYGIPGHLALRLAIRGDDMWIEDSVALSIRELVQRNDVWREREEWTHVDTWEVDSRMSTDRSEGVRTWTLATHD